jgi:ribosomal protein S18 acetylase RimI-like enzyme
MRNTGRSTRGSGRHGEPAGAPARIRPATVVDAPALGRLHVATWRAAYAHLVPGEVLDAISEEARASRWARILAESPDAALVAEREGELLGFASVGPGRDDDAAPGRTGELYALYVGPVHWGTGVGWRLWRAARQALQADGYDEVTLWVLEGNRRGRAFYERAGFVLDAGSRKTIDFHGVPLPEVRYRAGLG